MKRKHIKVNIEDEILNLLSRDFEIWRHNPYVVRISCPSISEDTYDWYFTTGTVIKNKYEKLKGIFTKSDDIANLFIENDDNENLFNYQINKD